MKCTKLAYSVEIFNIITPEFELPQLHEHKLCVSSDVHVDRLVVRVEFYIGLFDIYESSYAIIHNIGLHNCSCGIKENILNFALPLLCLVNGIHEIRL